jgi:glycosyltransferase involved in cell wall biosynthesis
MRRIFYFCPDFSPPSGGTKRLYRHVVHLNRLGFKAFIVHFRKGFSLTWHGYQVPVIWVEDQPTFLREDILVFPEGLVPLMKQTSHFNGSRVVIALNWGYVYKSLPLGENWKDYGIDQAMTPSRVIKHFLEWSMGIEVTLINNYIDISRYWYQPHKKKAKIAYMTRKDPSGEILRSIFQKKGGVFKAWEWMPLSDMSEDEYSQQLVESRIYLVTHIQEGIPTSALEAMASGCVVVGFSGIGGNDYMIGGGDKQNCFLVENGNFPELGKTLEQVIFQFENDTQIHDSLIARGIRTANQFEDFDREGVSLKRFFQSLGYPDH